jgi:hypothetical protein
MFSTDFKKLTEWIYERKVKILFEKVKFNLILSIANKDWLLDNLLINLKN